MPKPSTWTAGLALAAACALAAPAVAAPPASRAADDTRIHAREADDPSIHGRRYDSHRKPGNHAFETPGGWHGHPRHGFELGSHWDRTYPPALPVYGNGGVGMWSGPWFRGNAPWPLGNLDIEVQPE